jgi:predicted phage-related endonuclease
MKIRLNDLTTPRSIKPDRRQFFGGSDARIIMSPDESALIRLWKEKRGEAEPEDLRDNLIVQLGVATEPLNRTWYERNTGRRIADVQRRRSIAGWPQPSTAWSRISTPCSRPSSCCRGRSQKRRRRRNIWPNSSTTCG